MTPNEFYKQLNNLLDEIKSGKSVLTISPGPIQLNVGEKDALAAKLLLWIQEQLPDDATLGDLEDILLAALWWSHFWAAAPRSIQKKAA